MPQFKALPSRAASLDAYVSSERVMSETFRRLSAGDIDTMDDFVVSLNTLRSQVPVPDWQRYIADVIGKHPLRPLIHEEPFTRRAYEKPRGYAGDAPLLDLIYGDVPWQGPLSKVGQRLHRWANVQPACRSVQERRQILARTIDQVATERPSPRILSVACGHLREAQRSVAVAQGCVAEVVALDQDPESLAVVDREQRPFNVTPVRASIRRLLVAPHLYGEFDFAYSAGLYDYLADAVAQALTAALFTALRPGGLLLIANFAPQLRDIGYMEAIMEWSLLYRDERAVAGLTATVPPSAIAEQRLFRDTGRNVVYLMVRKC